MPRLLAIGAALAAAVTTVATAAVPAAHAASKPVHTSYLLGGSGYGLRLVGGTLPLNGGNAAHVSSGCTDVAPRSSYNHVAGVALPGGLGSIGAVSSHTWTSRNAGGVVNRYTRSRVANIKIGNSTGALEISGLQVTARAWHDKKGFHSTVTSEVGTLSATSSAVPVKLPVGKLPTPSQPIKIPGLLTLSAASAQKVAAKHYALAYSPGMLLSVTVPGQSVPLELRLDVVRAKISDGYKTGPFGGQSSASEASLLGGTVTSNGQPRQFMGCLGTNGKVQRLSVAAAPLGSVGFPLSAGTANSAQFAKVTSTSAHGFERASVANVDIGNGALLIKGIVAQANVSRTGRHWNTVRTTTDGTRFGTITENGTTYTASQLDGQKLSLPGLDGALKIQTDVVQRLRTNGKVTGLKVVGLRITLLSASGATTSVINLANAVFQVHHP